MHLLLLIVIFVAGCGASRKAVSQSSTAKQETVTSEPVPVEMIPEDTVPALPVIDTLDIGLILPFYLDSLAAIPDSMEIYYPPQSKLATEFYNGAMIALDELAGTGIPARIHVYDDANDKERIMNITGLADFKKMQLMIGPVYNNNLRIMSEYAKNDSIYLVSPLSPSMNITSYNPYYVMVNPSIEAHCRKLFDYIIAHHRNDNILLLTRPASPEEQYAAIFREYLRQYQNNTRDYSVQFNDVVFAPDIVDETVMTTDELMAFFDESKKNVVIVPSVEKAYIHSVGRSLYPLVDPSPELKDAVKYDVTVMGLPVWGDEEDLRLDYVQKLNVHFTSSYYLHPYFYSGTTPFYAKYLNTYKTEPGEYAVKGYDLMKFFAGMLMKYGNNFGAMLLTEKGTGIHTDFSFGHHYAPDGSLASNDNTLAEPRADFIENKYVHLLRYEDFGLIKIE